MEPRRFFHLRSVAKVGKLNQSRMRDEAGNLSALFDLAAQLRRGVPLRVGHLGKAARGWALGEAAPMAATRTAPMVLGCDMTIGQAMRAIVNHCLKQMQDNEPGKVVLPTPS